MRRLLIKWTFYLGTQLVVLGLSFRIGGVPAVGIRLAASAGIVCCVLAFANLAGEWKGKRDASR